MKNIFGGFKIYSSALLSRPFGIAPSIATVRFCRIFFCSKLF